MGMVLIPVSCKMSPGLSPGPGVVAGRSNPTPEARDGGQEDQPHFQGAVAARAQEGLEELSHVEDQEGWW